jgi:hypothetical protein
VNFKKCVLTVALVFLSIFQIYSSDNSLYIIENKEGLYLGHMKGDVFDEAGVMLYRNGDYYIGTWKNSKYDGPGILYKTNPKRGKMYWDQKLFYVWKEGKQTSAIHYQSDGNHTLFGDTKAGFGVYQSDDPLPETIFIGNFINNELSGLGTIELIDGQIFIGFMQNNQMYKEEIIVDLSKKSITHLLIDEQQNKKIIFDKKGYPEFFYK